MSLAVFNAVILAIVNVVIIIIIIIKRQFIRRSNMARVTTVYFNTLLKPQILYIKPVYSLSSVV